MTSQSEVERIAAGLSETQRKLIPHMDDGGFVYPLPHIAETVPMAVAAARKAVAGLREMGLAKHGPLYSDDDGRPNGSGTWLNHLGICVRDHLASAIPTEGGDAQQGSVRSMGSAVAKPDAEPSPEPSPHLLGGK